MNKTKKNLKKTLRAILTIPKNRCSNLQQQRSEKNVYQEAQKVVHMDTNKERTIGFKIFRKDGAQSRVSVMSSLYLLTCSILKFGIYCLIFHFVLHMIFILSYFRIRTTI